MNRIFVLMTSSEPLFKRLRICVLRVKIFSRVFFYKLYYFKLIVCFKLILLYGIKYSSDFFPNGFPFISASFIKNAIVSPTEFRPPLTQLHFLRFHLPEVNQGLEI